MKDHDGKYKGLQVASREGLAARKMPLKTRVRASEEMINEV